MKFGNGMKSKDVLAAMEKAGIIPVVVIQDPAKAVRLGRAILDAGLDLIEITMRTERAIEAIELLCKELPELLVGAGTVLSLPVAKKALSAGARFIVTPHLDGGIVTYCAKRDIVTVAGAFTASEIQGAIKAATIGAPKKSIKDLPLVIKIFPASSGGPNHLSAMKAPFPEVRFMPFGGVSASNVAEYIKAGAWAVGGTWMCKRELIEAGDFAKISELVKEALDVLAEARK